MATYKYLTIFVNLCLALLISDLSYGQIADSLIIRKDTLMGHFEKVTLDDKVFYRNKETNEFINQVDYIAFCANAYEELRQTSNQIIPDYSQDSWECDEVNPYKGVVLSTPFKIEFDQTTFTHPVDEDIVVTSRFGMRRRGPHRGLDIDLVTGDPVRSVLPGKVRFVGYSSGHGKTIVVRHANEVETVYAHLSEYMVETNDTISEGQVLGLGGNTGNSRGSHLHLEVRYKGTCIHPEYVFNFDGSRSIRGSELWVSNSWKSPRGHSSYRKSKLTPLHTEKDAIAAQNAEPRYHRVRKGETLSHIASKCHLGIGEICRLNSISRNSTLKIGQRIQIR